MAESFLNIRVILSDKEIYDKDLDADLSIDKNNIEKELMSQAGKFAWWSTLAELSRDKVNRSKKDLEVFEAQACQAIRAEKSKLGEKITEGGIGELMRLLPEWQQKKDFLLEAQKQAGVLDSAREAFMQRQFMLRSLAGMQDKSVDLGIMRAVAEETLRNSK